MMVQPGVLRGLLVVMLDVAIVVRGHSKREKGELRMEMEMNAGFGSGITGSENREEERARSEGG